MSISINPQNYSYERSVFEHPSKWYESYQENGTKYLKSRKPLDDLLKQQLNACSGEIFLSGIPPVTSGEQIAEIAALVGEIYILRFKVNFSGNSRGFAYLQYMNPNLMQLALMSLPSLFRKYSFPMIRVRESRNSSKLLLKKAYRMSPHVVVDILKKIIKFHKVIGHELYPGYFEYQIIFRCNEEAVHGRRELMRSISSFGHNAIVIWDTTFDNNAAALTQGINLNNQYMSSDNIQQSFVSSTTDTTAWIPNSILNRSMVSTQSSAFSSHKRFPTFNSFANSFI